MISVTHMVFNQHGWRALECSQSRGNSILACLLSLLLRDKCVCVFVSGMQVTEASRVIKGPRVTACLATLETRDLRVNSSSLNVV